MNPNILLVDDNAEVLEFIADDLREKYNVFTAADGAEAMEILKHECVHLVVTDVMMPVMDGFELCKNIKNDVKSSHIPVILLTAKNTIQSKIEGLEQGADAYVDKPFSPEYLQVQISNLLSNRNKIKEHFSNSPLVHIKTMAYSRADERFLEKVNEVIDKNMSNANLDVDHLADAMNMSRPTLYRKIKAISDLTPNDLINVTRLKRAAELLCEGSYRIFEIAEMVGYSSQSQFGRSFSKQFNVSPLEYAHGKRDMKESA